MRAGARRTRGRGALSIALEPRRERSPGHRDGSCVRTWHGASSGPRGALSGLPVRARRAGACRSRTSGDTRRMPDYQRDDGRAAVPAWGRMDGLAGTTVARNRKESTMRMRIKKGDVLMFSGGMGGGPTMVRAGQALLSIGRNLDSSVTHIGIVTKGNNVASSTFGIPEVTATGRSSTSRSTCSTPTPRAVRPVCTIRPTARSRCSVPCGWWPCTGRRRGRRVRPRA